MIRAAIVQMRFPIPRSVQICRGGTSRFPVVAIRPLQSLSGRVGGGQQNPRPDVGSAAILGVPACLVLVVSCVFFYIVLIHSISSMLSL